MKYGMKKRGLSLFLSVLMVVTAVPLFPLGMVTVNAAEENLTAMEPMVISQDTTLTDVQINGDTGQSAVVINGNVTLTIEGTVRLNGGGAGYNVGAGAGIEVPAGSSLTLKGSGTLYATGGGASNGEDGLPKLDPYSVYIEDDKYHAGGRGGGGAGAGIGGKGSDHGNASSVGSITIADENLLVNAVGGGGSSSGGSGGSGIDKTMGNRMTVDEDRVYILGVKYSLEVWGRYGGAGGGGGGFPAAGIGGGGASGGNGGYNGGGTYDSTSTIAGWTPPWPFTLPLDEGWFMVMGGAGGGGGAGYHPGGGGGTGAGSASKVTTDGTADARLVTEYCELDGGWYPSSNGLARGFRSDGGGPGEDGKTPTMSGYEYKGEKMAASAPGKAGGTEKGGAGGRGGSTFSGEKQAGNGGSGEDAGKKMAGGQVTLTAGTLEAKSGGGSAQTIGYGDGAGSASSGSFTIKGGTVKDYGSQTAVSTNGASQVYPVTVLPANSGVAIQEVLVNGSDFGVRRYLPDAGGQLILWLPNGTYTAEVITEDGASALYESFTVKDAGLSPTATLSDPVRLDVNNGNILFYKTRYEQNGVSGAYSGEAVLYDASGSGAKPDVFYENLDKDAYHQTILQNVSLESIFVIGQDDLVKVQDVVDTNDKYAKINLIPEGKGNRIEHIHMVDEKTDISFGGDADSELTVGSIGMEHCTVHCDRTKMLDYTYISELKLGISKYADKAKEYLRSAGFTNIIDVDLNKDAGGKYIYLGYKTTKNPDEAITNIEISNESISDWNPMIGYQRVEDADGEDPDLNLGADGDDLYMYYTKVDRSDGKKITKIDFFTYEGSGESSAKSAFERHLGSLCNMECCYKYKESMIQIPGGALADLNEDAGGDYIYGYFGLAVPDPPYQDHAAISNDDKHSGKVFMNGSGKVTVERVRTTGSAIAQNDTFWGTPSFEVNRGCLILPEYLQVSRESVEDYGILVTIFHNLDYIADGPGYHEVGSSTIGTITVNGGTLMFAPDGTGEGNVQLLSGNLHYFNRYDGSRSHGNTGSFDVLNDNFKKALPNAEAGGSVLMTDGAWNEASGAGNWITLTELPADSHMKNILRTDNDNICGDFQNQDIWTNQDGVMKTKVTADSHDIIFEDQDGNPYHYRYENGQVTKMTIPSFADAPESDAPVRVEEKYVVQGGSVFMLDDTDRLTITKNIPGGITVATDRNLTVSAENGVTIGNLAAATGKKLNLTIDGSGLISSGTISADTVKIVNTTVEAQAISGDITLQDGASVKTEEPIKGAKNENGTSVFQAVIPKWSGSFTLDESVYSNMGTAHGDGKMYLYVPADSKMVTVDGTDYSLEYVEDTQTMLVSEIYYGDGKIDLSRGSAEIIDETRYRHDDKVYVNTNGQNYEVYGTTTENTLTVKSDAQITLKDLTADCTGSKNSPISIAPGVSAVITLQGENTLTGGEGAPAIHVPAGAKLTIGGSGVLNAKASGTAAAIGGREYEENGKITIEGGTLNLTANLAAVGAGLGAETPEGSIVVTGGSIYANGSENVFGTTPVNGEGETLSRVVIKPNSAENVKVDGEDYHVNTANADGKLYLYLVSGKHTVKAGKDDYLVEPVRIADTENGSVTLELSDDDGYLALASGDMLVEGSVVRVRTNPDDGYSLFEGPQTGTYRAEQKDGKLTLAPVNVSANVYNDAWIPEIQEDSDSGDKGEENKSFTGNYSAEIKGSYTMNLGAAKKGDNIVSFRAMGKGMTAEILINGTPVKTVTLTAEKQELSYSFTSDGTDVAAIRYGGTGTVTMSDLLFGSSVDAGNVTAQFKKTYTLKVPAEFDPEAEDLNGYILLRNSKGEMYLDPNPSAADYQVFEGDTVTAYYVDPDGGSIVDGYTLTYADGSTQTVNQSELPLTFGTGHIEQDVTLALLTHLEPYYEIIIPETVAVSDTESSASIGAQNIKNMQDGDALNVVVGNLDAGGNATITRIGADNTLSVPVLDAEKNPLADGGTAAQFTQNNPVPVQGGTIYFGTPVGDKKAGDYTGTITFTIAYKEAGN